MIQISQNTKIFIGLEALDFRTGFNGTAAACRNRLGKNPLNGGLFVFINRSRTMIRLYLFDGHGEWATTKRIASGRFHWWDGENTSTEIAAEHIHLLLRGGNPNNVPLPPPWKKL